MKKSKVVLGAALATLVAAGIVVKSVPAMAGEESGDTPAATGKDGCGGKDGCKGKDKCKGDSAEGEKAPKPHGKKAKKHGHEG